MSCSVSSGLVRALERYGVPAVDSKKLQIYLIDQRLHLLLRGSVLAELRPMPRDLSLLLLVLSPYSSDLLRQVRQFSLHFLQLLNRLVHIVDEGERVVR